MKLIDLAAHISRVLDASPRNADLIVSIPNRVTGSIGSPTITVKYGVQGMDWTNGKFLIIPQCDMIAKENIPQEKSIQEIIKTVPQTNKTRHLKVFKERRKK